ncbi:aspartate homoserine dehydrogenase ii [Perilla frutescens var. hirtella]|nr:aspartate homoserine dehydrogenase ii [Perilla frutescens var. hirtella]
MASTLRVCATLFYALAKATALKEKFNIDLCLMDNTGSRNMLLSDMQVRHLTQGQYQYTQNGTLIDIL